MQIPRVQTGVRLDENLVAVLHTLAQQDRLTLGRLIENLLRCAVHSATTFAFTTTALDSRVTAARAQHRLDTHAASPFTPLQSPKRAQVGFKIDRHLLKLLKAVAELLDRPLNQLIESLTLAQLLGQPALTPNTYKKIRLLKRIYNAP